MKGPYLEATPPYKRGRSLAQIAETHPKYIDKDELPPVLRSWDIVDAPYPDPVHGGVLDEVGSMCSTWLNMNVLMLDEKRVIVDRSQGSMIKAMKGWGLEPIPSSLKYLGTFGGSFHCVTTDIRRRGTLQSYF